MNPWCWYTPTCRTPLSAWPSEACAACASPTQTSPSTTQTGTMKWFTAGIGRVRTGQTPEFTLAADVDMGGRAAQVAQGEQYLGQMVRCMPPTDSYIWRGARPDTVTLDMPFPLDLVCCAVHAHLP
jgi:hypothetical protein